MLTSKTVQKLASEEANNVIQNLIIDHQKLKEKFKTKQMSNKRFELFKPLYSGLRDTSYLALFQNILLIVRRMTLLYVAMFLPDMLLQQLITFLVSSLVALNYSLNVRLFESKSEDRLNIVNETTMLLIVYLLICVASFQASSTDIGTMICWVIWASWSTNGLVAVYLTGLETYSKLRRCFHRRRNKQSLQLKQVTKRERAAGRKSNSSVEAVSSAQPQPLHVFTIGCGN